MAAKETVRSPANPSFLEGVSRILDFGNTLKGYDEAPQGWEADYYALYADWSMVGRDIVEATLRFKHEQADSQV